MQHRDRYSRTQIVLHWTIAFLILFQFLLPRGIEHAWRAFRHGTFTQADFSGLALAHLLVGITVLVLAVWRLSIRLRHGAPAPDPAEPPALQWLAKAVHFILYVLLFYMPLTGLTAWVGGVAQAGAAHHFGKLALLAVVSLHVLGALVHQFWWRTPVLKRMLGMA